MASHAVGDSMRQRYGELLIQLSQRSATQKSNMDAALVPQSQDADQVVVLVGPQWGIS